MAETLSKFERELIEAVKDMKAGKSVPRVGGQGSPRRGRPPQAVTKLAIKLRLDRDLVEALRDTGPGWQTRANAALRREFLQLESASSQQVAEIAAPRTSISSLYLLEVQGAGTPTPRKLGHAPFTSAASLYRIGLDSGITV